MQLLVVDPVAVILGAMSMVSSAEECYSTIIYRVTDQTTLISTI